MNEKQFKRIMSITEQGEHNIKRTITRSLAIAVGALAVTLSLTGPSYAAELIKPQIGEPLRDAAVTRAPDGTYFLTGGRTTNQYNGKADFLHNDGIKLWSSKDLVTWKEAGFALDLKSRSGWKDDPLLQFYFLPERPLSATFSRALTLPRIAFLGGEAFLSFSMLGHDVRWLRAPDGTGPWKDGRLHEGKPPKSDGGPRALRHINGPGNGFLLEGNDGIPYLFWGPGYLAPLNAKKDDIVHDSAIFLLSKIAGYPNHEWCARQYSPTAFSLMINDGTYLLTWSAFTDAGGFKRQDSFVATADALTGPYSEPKTLIPGSGPVVLFDAAEKGLMASCSIADQPMLIPLTLSGANLSAAVKPSLPDQPKAVKSGKPLMYDYAKAVASGKRSERVGEELKYKVSPVFADKAAAMENRVGRSKLVPLFDLPVADVSVCRGDGNVWYLTATVASKNTEGNPDFCNNDGIYLWKSSDLETWTPMGKVWDLEIEGGEWQKTHRIPGDNSVRDDLCRGVSSPEIHFMGGTYWMAYSMNGRGTGLLKSKSGKAEGPYQDLGRLTGMGESPTLFSDPLSGKTFWLFGQGLQMAELDAASNSLRGEPKDLYLQLIGYPAGGWDAFRTHYWDLTAPFLFTAMDPKTKKPIYALAFSAITQTFQRANRDALVAVGPSLDGLFQAASRMIPNGGQTTVFPGPAGAMCATFWGADGSAVFRERPAIVPMEWLAHANVNWPRMIQGDFPTTRGPWAEIMPPPGVPGTRDISVFKDKDGYYYYSGSPGRGSLWENGIRFWRAKDLKGPWQDIGFLYTMEEMRDDPNWPDIKEDKDKNWNNNKGGWEPSISFGNGTYWLSLWFGGHGWGKEVVWKKSIGALLKSTSGKVTGPYVFHSEWVHDFQGLLWIDGVAYGYAATGNIWRMTEDLKGVDITWTDRIGKPLVGRSGVKGVINASKSICGRIISEDCGITLYRIGEKWVCGGLTQHCGYDGVFTWADDIRGPWRYMGAVPNLGNAPVVQNIDGKWLTLPQCGNVPLFGTPYRDTDKTNPNSLFLYEVVFDMDGPEPSVWPKHDLGHLGEAVYRK